MMGKAAMRFVAIVLYAANMEPRRHIQMRSSLTYPPLQLGDYCGVIYVWALL